MPPTTPGAAPVYCLEGVRLPKAVEADATGPALHAALRAHAQLLWSGGALLVPAAPWSAALAEVLSRAQREGSLMRGLEAAERALEREARGLGMVDARSTTVRGSRVSRLLLVGGDGTERFYRQVERLARTHATRLLVIRVDADSGQLASVVPHAAGVVRALMLEHKEDVARVLGALYVLQAAG